MVPTLGSHSISSSSTTTPHLTHPRTLILEPPPTILNSTMARLTVIPTAEAIADPCKTNTTRPEPQPPTPLPHTSNASPSTAENDKLDQPGSSQTSSSVMPTPSSSQFSILDNTSHHSDHAETTTFIARTDDDLIAALRLISDTVAQQHQLAARAILLNPYYWAIVLLPLPYSYVEWRHNSPDWSMLLVLWTCILTASVMLVKCLVHGYLNAAEQVGRWSWLYGDQWIKNRFGTSVRKRGSWPRAKRLSGERVDTDPDFKTDCVFVTKLGGKVIAALVVRMTSTWELNPYRPFVFKGRRDHLQRKAVIRAWAVEQRYRGLGVGIALLRFVVRWCVDNEIGGPEFADDHAHSLRLLPRRITPEMDLLDRRARTTLYWEIQHYNSSVGDDGRGERMPDGDSRRKLKEKQKSACHDGLGVETNGGAVSSPRFERLFSTRRQDQMSRDITKQILRED